MPPARDLPDQGVRGVRAAADGRSQEVWRWKDDTLNLREKDYKKAVNRALEFFERHHGKPANRAKATRDLTAAVKRAAAAAERQREERRADGEPVPTSTDIVPVVGEVVGPSGEVAGAARDGFGAHKSRAACGAVATTGRDRKDPLLPRHREELEEGSGLSAATIAEIGFYSANPVEAAGLLNWPNPNPVLGRALVVPYPGTDGHAQLKFDTSRKDEDGQEIKYESPTGSAARLFVPPDAMHAVLTTADDLGSVDESVTGG